MDGESETQLARPSVGGTQLQTSTTTAASSGAAVVDSGSRAKGDRELDTDDLLPDLAGRSVRGSALTMGTQASRFILQMGSTAVLARLLTPADFGLFAMVIPITGLVAKFKDAGLSTATIQREKVTSQQVSTLFWINVALSLAIFAVLSAAAPLVAMLFGRPELTLVTIALAGTIVFGGLTVQHQALLRRRMRFGVLASIEMASIIAGIAVAIVLASMGAKHWALVAQAGAIAVVNCVLVWMVSSWRPGLPRREEGVGSMLRFGGGMSVFHLMDYAVRNLDNVLIGFVLGAGPLGIYSKAYNLLMMPIRQFNAPMGGVLTPALSRLQGDPKRFRLFYIQVVAGIAFVTVPVVGFLFADAENAVLTVLGDQWTEAVGVFRYLAPAALFSAVNVAPTWLCLALGNSGRAMRWSLISAPLTLLAVAAAIPFGLNMIALAFSLSWTPAFLWFVVYACKGTPVKVLDVARALAPAVVGSVAAGLGAYTVSAWTSVMYAAPVALFLDWLVFGAIYVPVYFLAGGGRLLPVRALVRHLSASHPVVAKLAGPRVAASSAGSEPMTPPGGKPVADPEDDAEGLR